MQLVHLIVWIAKTVNCLIEGEMRGGHRQKMDAGTYFSYLIATVEHLVGQVSSILESQLPKELYLAPAQYNRDLVIEKRHKFLVQE